MSLNPQQRAAVAHVDGPLLVLAGAGSGKTRVITEKIAYLVDSGRMQARHIAAITFTNKSAREMKERVAKRLPGDRAEGLTVCTFHALGLRFLQIEHAKAGLRRGFSIFDSDDQLGIIKDLCPKGVKPDVVEAVRQLVSKAKNEALSPEEAAALARSPREVEAATVYGLYQARLAAFNAVDFDDLIRLPVRLLEGDAELAAAWRERLRYLLVDECQDTNGAQYRLLRQLAGPKGLFTCVGDDDQSIYAWRGADPENLLRLGADYPSLRVIKLEQNYRCSARILRAANTLIANNPHEHLKTLWSTHPDGPPIRVWPCRDAEHEAERVAAEIAFRQESEKTPWGEFAILFRSNFQSRALEKALQRLRVPYHLSGGTAFLDRGEVKDALAWLRVLANPDDDSAFLRAIAAPKREVGSASLAKLAELARTAHMPLSRACESLTLLKQLTPRAAAGLDAFASILRTLRAESERLTPAELCRSLIERSGMLGALRASCKDEALFQRRRANLDDLASWFEAAPGMKGRPGPGELAAQLALLTHADRGEPGNQVRLMSLHAAKGLEFDAVFIVGVEDGVLPHEASIDEARLDEERRLFYVGITRARKALWLSHSAQARKWGEVIKLTPSRFLAELPAGDLFRDGDDPERDAEHKRERGKAQLAAIAALFDD
ncbi:UvrD-helicase domain-containing protein [Coralloluteibacterium stylophorae]|uniref:ATP-dependent DNA helicase Rep n=1 Tax=Coralloluteibacterium stylophorae TaxID=1776034 RepID=A0A8J7VUU8_9GAMM|nr:UvrD-helicase domain-containing protein [Coralloluteibacterium stylophorae]MBS7457105.1 UvrD-helicase domain-containing protein [Coralloluteibacterium stylophorae]